MDAVAIFLQVLKYGVSVLGVRYCMMLFRQYRQPAWLLIGPLFAEPWFLLILRAVRGQTWFVYRRFSSDALSHATVTYVMEFQVLQIMALLGLYLLVRQSREAANRSC